MAQICILALIGLPAVGKTTFSKLLLELETLPFNALHICYDNFVRSDPNTATTSYKEQRDILLKSILSTVESLQRSMPFNNTTNFEQACSYKKSDCNRVLIICDDNHYYSSMRYKLYKIARQLGLSYGQIFIECNVDMAYHRNSLRSIDDRVPEEAFHKMSLHLETPQSSSHYWDKNTLNLHTDNINKSHILSDIVPFIMQLFDNALEPLEPTMNNNSEIKQSRVHDLDLIIRKRIGLLMNSNVNFNKKCMAKVLNDKRKEILKDFQEKSDVDQCLRLFEEYLESTTGV